MATTAEANLAETREHLARAGEHLAAIDDALGEAFEVEFVMCPMCGAPVAAADMRKGTCGAAECIEERLREDDADRRCDEAMERERGIQ